MTATLTKNTDPFEVYTDANPIIYILGATDPTTVSYDATELVNSDVAIDCGAIVLTFEVVENDVG